MTIRYAIRIPCGAIFVGEMEVESMGEFHGEIACVIRSKLRECYPNANSWKISIGIRNTAIKYKIKTEQRKGNCNG